MTAPQRPEAPVPAGAGAVVRGADGRPVRHVVLAVGAGPRFADLLAEVEPTLADVCEVVALADGPAVQRWMREAGNDEAAALDVSLVVHLAGEERSNDLMRLVTDLPGGEKARLLLITDRAEHNDLAWVVDNDRLDGVVADPWTQGRLSGLLRAHVRRRQDDIDWYARAGRTESLPPRHEDAERPPVTQVQVRSALLRTLAMSTDDVIEELITSLEAVLGPRPRLHLPPGVRIIHEDDEIHAVLLMLKGRVSMTVESRAGEVVLHHASTGPVIGLLSLSDRERAFVTARTTTEAEVVHLSIEQLDRALRESPEVGAALTAVSIRVLSARLRRAQALHVEKFELATELDEERAHLAEALAALERARTQLIAQARFATLGELSAGIAHELNNPIAAMSRAADHLQEDVARLVRTHPEADLLTSAIAAAAEAAPSSTRDQRAWRREVESVVGDREVARRLVAAGIHDRRTAKRFVGRGADTARTIELLEIASGIGASVRNLRLAGSHVTGLVTSLRAQARPDAARPVATDINQSLRDALRLTGHRLRDVSVEWDLAQGLPEILAHPGSLGQVWTNLVVNAVDAMTAPTDGAGGATGTADAAGAGTADEAAAGAPVAADDRAADLAPDRAAAPVPPSHQGRLRITTRTGPDEAADPARPGADTRTVQVTITDNGPGIDPENLERIFQPQFTTKHGQVRYGLGMGLGITRKIVEDHGGTITVDSSRAEPSRTAFTVVLPVAGPPPEHAAPDTDPPQHDTETETETEEWTS